MKNQAIQVFQTKKKSIFDNWIELQIQDESLREDIMSNEEHHEQSEELLTVFIDSLSDITIVDPHSVHFERVIDLLSAISIKRARQGFSPRDTGAYMFSLKDALLNALAKEITDKSILYDQSLKINKLLDSLCISTFETFIKGREEVILRQTDEMDEISTPVIQVWDGILALPIIGTLDSARTQIVMENLLQEIVESESHIAILDISGVPSVDSMVAQHLIKTVTATRLMGAECIISGIRPEIAQTVVHLGIDLSNITTKATLADALKTAFSLLRLEVGKR